MKKSWLLSVSLSLLTGLSLALFCKHASAEETRKPAPASVPHWQKASQNMLRDRAKLIYELHCVVIGLNLSERKSATIAFNDKQGMQAVEAIRLLGQLRADGEVYTLVDYLNLKAPVMPDRLSTLFDVYPTAGALAQIGVASLDFLLIPDKTQVIYHHNAELETRLIAAIVQKVLGHKIGIAYAEERLKQMDAGKARTRLAGIVHYLKTHTAQQIETGNVPTTFTD